MLMYCPRTSSLRWYDHLWLAPMVVDNNFPQVVAFNKVRSLAKEQFPFTVYTLHLIAIF